MPTSTKRETVAGESANLVKTEVNAWFRDIEEYLNARNGQKGGQTFSEVRQHPQLLSNMSGIPLPLQNLISEVGEHGLQQLCNLLRESFCLGVDDASEQNSILQSLMLKIVQSGFVSSVDIPISSSYEPDAAVGKKIFVQDTERRTLHRFVSSHFFTELDGRML